MRSTRSALASACLLLGIIGIMGIIGPSGPVGTVGAARAAAATGPAIPTLTADTDTIRADTSHTWHVTMFIHNPLTWGLYPDSLELRFEDTDPGVTGLPRVNTQRMDALVKVMEPVSGGESSPFDWTGPALFEHGRVGVRLYTHDAQKQPYELVQGVVVGGSDLADAFPSKFVGGAGHHVELVLVPSAKAPAPSPGLLLVHGHGSHARHMLRMASTLSQAGWNVALVSQPGYGQSDGPADGMGPATVAALGEALEALKKMPGTDARHVAVWGVAQGATAALLLAAHGADLCGVVAQGAGYDLWASHRGSSPERRASIEREAGGDSTAWRARSPLFVADRIRVPVMVLHGDRDETAPVAGARAFIAARESKKLPVEANITERGVRSRVDPSKSALDFLGRCFAR